MPLQRKLTTILGTSLFASGLIFPAMAAAQLAAAKPHRFNIAGATFSGSAKTICVIEGKWKDGEYFRFEAWDECSEMRMRRFPATELKEVRPLGTNKSQTVADIPAGAEMIEVSNDHSSVLLFRDAHGIMREILFRD